MLQRLEVGEPYPGQMKNGAFLEYNNGFTLYLFLPNITSGEAKSIRKGKYKFALTEMSDMLFFLYEFKPDINISDSPFHFGLHDDSKKRIKNLPDTVNDPDGLPLQVIAVDNATGVIKALRQIGLGTRFSKRLISICNKQSEKEINKIDYANKITDVQQRYNAKQLLRFSSIICK